MSESPERNPTQSAERARLLRRNSTFPERLLWGQLRSRRLAGLKFRRQHPLGGYVLDFFCDDAQLAVELDGESHVGQADYDPNRQRWIEGQGVRVLRFGNDDVLRDMNSVLEGILLACGIRLDDSKVGKPSP